MNYSIEIDETVYHQLKQGNKQAFNIIYWKYNARIYNFALSLLPDRDAAEDITQSVFLKIWERREMIDLKKSFNAYIFTIAKNLVYKELIHRMETEQISDSDVSSVLKTEANDIEEEISAHSLQEYIEELISQLPPGRQRIFLLSRKEGLSIKEIANKLQISERTVETQLYRSLQFLKKALANHGGMGIILINLLFEN